MEVNSSQSVLAVLSVVMGCAKDLGLSVSAKFSDHDIGNPTLFPKVYPTELVFRPWARFDSIIDNTGGYGVLKDHTRIHRDSSEHIESELRPSSTRATDSGCSGEVNENENSDYDNDNDNERHSDFGARMRVVQFDDGELQLYLSVESSSASSRSSSDTTPSKKLYSLRLDLLSLSRPPVVAAIIRNNLFLSALGRGNERNVPIVGLACLLTPVLLFLEPQDIVSVSKTCKQLHEAIEKRGGRPGGVYREISRSKTYVHSYLGRRHSTMTLGSGTRGVGKSFVKLLYSRKRQARPRGISRPQPRPIHESHAEAMHVFHRNINFGFPRAPLPIPSPGDDDGHDASLVWGSVGAGVIPRPRASLAWRRADFLPGLVGRLIHGPL